MPPRCRVDVGSSHYAMDLEQAANATTITAVAKQLGLPDHAVTIALATALQESKLHNLAYGDRDSLGLFQQRPSQGWGTRTQIMDPRYSSAAFFKALARVPGWETMSVTNAAQAVQHSNASQAYAVGADGTSTRDRHDRRGTRGPRLPVLSQPFEGNTCITWVRVDRGVRAVDAQHSGRLGSRLDDRQLARRPRRAVPNHLHPLRGAAMDASRHVEPVQNDRSRRANHADTLDLKLASVSGSYSDATLSTPRVRANSESATRWPSGSTRVRPYTVTA